jgi:hypothetical protein
MNLVPVTEDKYTEFHITFKTGRKVYVTDLLHSFLAEKDADNPYFAPQYNFLIE